MPQTKRPFLRYQVIDRELGRIPNKRVKTSALQNILLQEFDVPVSMKTLQMDIEAMKSDSHLGYYAPIGYDEKVKAYFYEDSSYSIQKFGLKTEEISSLDFMLNVFKQYSNHGILQQFVSAIDKIENTLKIERSFSESKSPVWEKVSFDLPFSTNIGTGRWIPLIIQAIDQKRKIEIGYRKYGEENSSQRLCVPAWLKEYQGLWYLIADDIDGKRKTFALDRITQIQILDEHAIPKSLDLIQYYKYSMGITSDRNEPIEIIISCDHMQGNYLKAAPIHTTQKVLFDTVEEFRVCIKVIPSYELYAKLRSYGSNITVISPPAIRKMLIEDLKQALSKYI